MQTGSGQVVTTEEIGHWLPPGAFPADGDMLADEAQVRGGPRRLVTMLRRLPAGRVYQSIGQTVRELRALRQVRTSEDAERVPRRPRRRLDLASRSSRLHGDGGRSVT